MSEIKVFSSFRSFGLCIAVIYTKRLVDFPKIGVALFVVLVFSFFFTEEECWDLPCDAHWWSVLAFITPVLNTPDEQVHLSRTIHIVEGNVNMGNKNIHITEDYFDVYKNFKNHLPNLLYLEEGQTTKQVKFGKETDYRATNSYWFIGYIPRLLDLGLESFEFECRSLPLSWSNFLMSLLTVF